MKLAQITAFATFKAHRGKAKKAGAAPRVVHKPVTRRPQLTCRWVEDAGNGQLVCRWDDLGEADIGSHFSYQLAA